MSPFAHLLYPRPARGGDTTTTSASTTPYVSRSPGTMDTTATPSTPGSTIRNPTTVITPPSTATTATTGSTDMNQRVTLKRPSGCPAEIDQYVKISVHTAKCSVCDKRNGTDQMLRCPTCSWEICQPCQQEREQKGGMLIIGHGKVGITETPESRARLFTPTKPGVGVHRKAPGPNNNQTPAPKTATTPKTTTATRNKDSNSNNNMQDDGKGEKRVAAVDEPAPASSPPDTDNNSRPVRKRRACVQTSTSDVEYDDDNNVAHVADKSSPTMPNKRSKTNAGASRGKRPATEAETASSPLLTQRQNTAAEKEFMAQNRKEVKEYWGPAFDGYTNEGHLLSRRLPPPETRIPDRVKQMAGEVKKRPSAEEIQRRIQTKLREKLGIPEEDDDARTIREFVDKISGEHLGVGKLTPDDTDTLIYSVRKFLEETIKIQYAKGCLDLPLATLDLEQKNELAGVIADVLDDLKGNSAG